MLVESQERGLWTIPVLQRKHAVCVITYGLSNSFIRRMKQ